MCPVGACRVVRPRVVVVEPGFLGQSTATQLQRTVRVPREPVDHDVRVQRHPVDAAAVRVRPHQTGIVTFYDRLDALDVIVQRY